MLNMYFYMIFLSSFLDAFTTGRDDIAEQQPLRGVMYVAGGPPNEYELQRQPE